MLQVLALTSDDQRMNGDFFIDPHSTFEPSLGNLSSDKDFIEKAVTVYGSILCELDDSFKNNRELALKAVTQYGRTFACLSKALRNDRELTLSAVKQDGTVLLMGLNPKFLDDKEIVLTAIKQAGPHVLAGVSSKLQKTKMCLNSLNKWLINSNNAYIFRYFFNNTKSISNTLLV